MSRICSRDLARRSGFFSIEALNDFRSLKPCDFAIASISPSIRATSRSPIWWICSGVKVVVVDWRARKAYRSTPCGSDHMPTSARPAGAYSFFTNAANLRYAG